MGRYVADGSNKGVASGKDEMYDLFGVLVHIGGGLHFGHYYCYVKNSNNMWYCMNDSSVS
jgi:ubiquitin carboxyl-terminal hydrolase 36/42